MIEQIKMYMKEYLPMILKYVFAFGIVGLFCGAVDMLSDRTNAVVWLLSGYYLVDIVKEKAMDKIIK